MLTPVILSGGAGTRLWPLSRELYPKQLLALTGERTMLQQTALRLSGLAAASPVVVCNDAHRFLVAEQLRQLKMDTRAVVLEPFGRNTAPAIALAALAALKMAAGERPRAAGSAGRPCHPRRDGISKGRPDRLAGSPTGQAGDVRYRAERSRNRLRLYPTRH